MNEYDRALGPAEISVTKDVNIDFSDIAELDETFWQQAKLVEPDRTEQVTARAVASLPQRCRNA